MKRNERLKARKAGGGGGVLLDNSLLVKVKQKTAMLGTARILREDMEMMSASGVPSYETKPAPYHNPACHISYCVLSWTFIVLQ